LIEGWETKERHNDHKRDHPSRLRRYGFKRWRRKRWSMQQGGKDAGSGPTPGATGQTITTGSAETKEHPPTETMNRVAGDKAMSSQDTQRQQQGQPTAAQEAQGAKPSAKMADQGC